MDTCTVKLTDAQLDRAIYSNWDFQQALSALTFLLEECNFECRYSRIQLRRFRCFETTVIVAFSRPFAPSRGRHTLGLRALGVTLTDDELQLKSRVLSLRAKIIAHSDEELMHFKGVTIHFEDSSVAMPVILYQETLYLEQAELVALEALLKKLIHGIATKVFHIAQSQPERLNVYKSPS